MQTISKARIIASCLALGAVLAGSACRRNADEVPIETRNPKAAASQLEKAFATADTETVEEAKAVSEAMQSGQYERAVTSLQVIREKENLTVEQGMAVHGSIVSMETQLIQAMQAGDPNAKRAYELLKALKRN